MVRPYTVGKPFRFWCQKILPLVYDDSLSYYELLNKVVDYLNKVINNVNSIGEAFNDLTGQFENLQSSFNELQEMVDNYFNNLDVQQEINNKLDEMAEDGTLDAIIQPLVDSAVSDAVSEWLKENVNPTGSAVVVDSSLTVSGAAADAKVTGDEISNLKSELSDMLQPTKNINTASIGRFFVQNGIIKESNAHSIGLATTIAVESSTDYAVSVFGIDSNTFHLYIFFYDSNNEYISKSNLVYYNLTKSKAFTTPASANYLALYIYNGNVDLPLSQDTHIQIEKGTTPSDVYYPPYSARDVNAEAEIENIKHSVSINNERLGCYLTDLFDIGNIAMSTNGWTYGAGSGPTRVRTKPNVTLRLKKGTVVGLTSYANALYYIGIRYNTGEYIAQGWLSADYTIQDDCDAVILIRNRTETEQDSPIPLASMFFGYSLTDYLYQNQFIDYDKVIKNINHRGYNTIAPENTLPAYQLSKQMGFNIVETDVSFTSDNVPVCLHDSTINRTARNSDGTTISETINIFDVTYEQLLNYDFGIWKSSEYAGTKIPTLEQFLILCRNIGLDAYVEIKSSETYTEEQIHSLMDLAERCGMKERVTWISFLPTYLRYVANYDSTAKLIYVVGQITDEVISNAVSLKNGGNLLAIDASSHTDAEVDKCIAAGIPLEVWTVNTEPSILALQPYITGVTSNSMIAGKVLYSRNIHKT